MARVGFFVASFCHHARLLVEKCLGGTRTIELSWLGDGRWGGSLGVAEVRCVEVVVEHHQARVEAVVRTVQTHGGGRTHLCSEAKGAK